MAQGGGPRGGKRAKAKPGARPGRARDRAKAGGAKAGGAKKAGASEKGGDARRRVTPKPSPAPAPQSAENEASGPFRLGAIPGATPGRWIDAWKERMPRSPLELVPLAFASQRVALLAGEVDAALVRLPIGRTGLHVIVLYDEVPVVVMSAESHLTAADELDLDDLAGEIVIVPRDDVLDLAVPGAVTPSFDPPETTEEAIATVAAGVGVVIVPLSLARLHHRKDAAHRPLRDGPVSTVALAWVADRTTAAVEAFIGIARGRTANSSRD
ncbi:MAG: LysR substrate-binding domain-containing protein [Microbacterium sp.]